MSCATSESIEIEGTCSQECPIRLQDITERVAKAGGWILSRSNTNKGFTVFFEFEEIASIEIYCSLVAVGVELNRSAHRCLTLLCQFAQMKKIDSIPETMTIKLVVHFEDVIESRIDLSIRS